MADIMIGYMEMPMSGVWACELGVLDANTAILTIYSPIGDSKKSYKLTILPERHGRLIDADELRKAMFHEAFETDSPMQKWESGCWIRYKMFERNLGNAPTIAPAEGGDEYEIIKDEYGIIKVEKKLKPCPFCGCHRVTILRDNETLDRFNILRYRAVCAVCAAQIYRGRISQLVEDWNTRTEQTEVSENG